MVAAGAVKTKSIESDGDASGPALLAHPLSALVSNCPPAADASATRAQLPRRFVASPAYRMMSPAPARMFATPNTAQTHVTTEPIRAFRNIGFSVRLKIWKVRVGEPSLVLAQQECQYANRTAIGGESAALLEKCGVLQPSHSELLRESIQTPITGLLTLCELCHCERAAA